MFGLIWQQVKDLFPERKEARHVDVHLVARPQGIRQTVTPRPHTRYLSRDGLAFLRVGENTLSVHHLAPYPTWQGFKPLVHRGFSAYVEAVKPSGLTTVALRYVNKISFDPPRVELSDYFEFYPWVGAKIAEDYGPFIVGIVIPFEDDRDVLRLQLAMAEPENTSQLPVLLDLDYRTSQAQPAAAQAVADWLDVAHKHIEETFEGCIKDSLRARFGETA